MKALVYNGPRRLDIEERPVPQPGPGEALLRVSAAGICGSEIEGYLGYNSLRVPPLVMGHEFSGEIIAAGSQHEENGLHIGQSVTVNPLIACGTCALCQAGRPQICSQRKLIGAHLPGGFADYVTVPTRTIIPLPEGVSPIMGALTEPFAVAIHGVELAQIQPGDGVVIWGAGSIGLLTLCAVLQKQSSPIIVVDTNPVRLETARTMGATMVLDAREDGTVERIRTQLNATARTVVLDAVGHASTRLAAVAAAGSGGTVVLLGLHDRETTFDVWALIRQEISLLASYAYTEADIQKAVALLASGQVKAGPWLEARPLNRGSESFAELVDRPGIATKIMLIPEIAGRAAATK